MACSYTKHDVQFFVDSLRHTGFDGDIVLGAEANDDDSLEYFRQKKVTTHAKPCVEQQEAADRGDFIHVEQGSLNQTEWTSFVTELESQDHAGRVRLIRSSEGRGGRVELARGSSGRMDASSVPILPGLNQRRHAHYKKWLLEGNYTAVWMLDSKDVFFQRDPFADPLRRELTLVADKPMQDKGGWTQKIEFAFCEPAKLFTVAFGKRANLCGGTIGGTRQAVLEFLDSMIQLVEQKVASGYNGNEACSLHDQYLLNQLAYDRHLKYYDLWEGPVLNVESVCKKLKRHTNNVTGELIDRRGVPFAIVHKWNKCEESKEMAHNVSHRLGARLPSYHGCKDC